MKIKLDENINPRAGGILSNAGHDVLTVQNEKLSGAPDDVIEEVLIREQRCLLTLDLDFANAVAYPPHNYSGIVVLRHPRPTTAGLLNLVRQFAVALDQHDPHQRLWIVEPGRIRIHEPTDEEDSRE